MSWSWEWAPHASASFGDNPIFDWARVLCVVLGMVLVMAMARVMIESTRRDIPMPPTQLGRFVSLSLAVGYISGTEIAVVGTPATPRLMVGLVAVAVGIYGVWGMRRKQRNDPPFG
jgi:O-antigen/teichoic acid export membrane protein